jgi:uncharacterized protein YycO
MNTTVTRPAHCMRPAFGEYHILLFRGRGIISQVIRWQTRSPYSHAAILLPDTQTIIEAWQFKGVQRRQMTDWKGVDAFTVPCMNLDQWKKAADFAQQQIGLGYDYRGVLRFVSRARNDDNQRWFCSELVFRACEAAGVPLLSRIHAGAVAPSHLALSPLLKGPVWRS